MNKILALFKWVGISGVVITLLNIFGVAAFLLIRATWNPLIFLRTLLWALILEGLVIALIGCLSFFGVEKYRVWLRGEGHPKQHEGKEEPLAKNKSRLDMRLVILTLGILLFFIAFTCFSLVS